MLTAKQEAFVKNIIDGMSQADAYRSAYDTQRMKDKTVWERASALMKNNKVATRLQELRDQMMKPSIMSAQERLELLSRIARGEELEKVVQYVEGVRIDDEIPASLKSRREAIDIMNKMTGEYTTKISGDVNINAKLEDLL
jgi:phage terminase small subunit